ncbi:hypothetical protein BD414DRAFT_56130 [Trametes punicea]|nr:hypothetical protein BD414DRAFT_56130 [Trametes punicea]
MIQLPPEIFSAIVSYAAPRDLLTLSRTSRAFQRAAEPRIYESMTLRDAQSIYLGCHALLARNASRAPYVKRMVIYQDPRRVTARNNLAAAPPQFWLAVQHALTKTVNLESLVVHDPTCAHSWILDHEHIKFQLREATLRLPWDAHTVSFLQTQHKLLSLAVADAREDGPLYPLSPAALPILETFNGPVLVVAEVLGSPLKRIQMTVEEETTPFVTTIVAGLGKIMKTLRNLCIVGLPEDLVLETLYLVSISGFASQLRYLGVLPLPVVMREWHCIHRSLMKLPALAIIELDVTSWETPPNEHFQRVIIIELRTFCPTLQQVVFWISVHRFHWYARNGQWGLLHQTGRYQVHDNLWRS